MDFGVKDLIKRKLKEQLSKINLNKNGIKKAF
jgi:hypothetical protein